MAVVVSRRRCGAPFVVAPGAILPSCPKCGKSPKPLWQMLRDNRVAAVLSVLALLVLTIAINLPFISMSKLGEVRIFSLLSGIIELFDRGQIWIGCVLLIFSVIFPYLKLLGLLLATSALVPLSDRGRQRLHHIAHLTGR